MTNQQLYLAIGLPTLFNAVLVGILVALVTTRFDALNQRFDDIRDLWRSELRRVDEILDVRFEALGRTAVTIPPHDLHPPHASDWDAILFDFDGVLADTEPVHFVCWRDLLQPVGIHIDWDFYQRECVGVADRPLVERLAASQNPPVTFETIRPLFERKKEMFRSKLESDPPFLPRTSSAIETLSRIYKLAVVSSSARSEVEPALIRAGLRPYFELLVCGKEAEHLKPAPDPYLLAAKLLGARNPLVVEDSDAGVASGTAAGFEVLRVSDAGRAAQELCDYIARSQPAGSR